MRSKSKIYQDLCTGGDSVMKQTKSRLAQSPTAPAASPNGCCSDCCVTLDKAFHQIQGLNYIIYPKSTGTVLGT